MDEATKQALVNLTREAWDANVREDASYYRDFLTDDALGVTPYGVIDKASLVQMMEAHSGMPFSAVDIDEPRIIELTPDSVLLVYTATIHAGQPGQEVILTDNVTTAYVRRDGVWKGAFQQHSPIAKE